MIDYYEIKSLAITRKMVWDAYSHVRKGGKAAGIDEMTWKDFDAQRSRLIHKLWNRMSSGSYFPPCVLEVEIPKSDGGKRKLGIPTVMDRIAQQVVRKYLEEKTEVHFHNNSFGYRPNRSAHDAVERSCGNCFGHDFALDLDIKGFFDTIDHELLMKSVRRFCTDNWVLLYVERWLKAETETKDGKRYPRTTGTPQGGVISPLLANIFLHFCFDRWMDLKHPEKPFERYADDIVVHCKTEKQARFVLKQIKQRMEICKLELHPVKTKIVNLRGKSKEKYPKKYDFLGFTIRPQWCKIGERGMLLPSIFISNKSEQGILKRFRQMKLHKHRGKLEEIAQRINPVIRGIINYYGRFSKGHLRYVLDYLNKRLLKWVKWEKGCFKMASVRYLQTRFRENPQLFVHWSLIHP